MSQPARTVVTPSQAAAQPPASDQILDLLDAITEARVANPQLRASVLAALRFASGDALLQAARLVTLRHDGAERAIISHGEATVGEDEDRRLVAEVREKRLEVDRGDLRALPLGKG